LGRQLTGASQDQEKEAEKPKTKPLQKLHCQNFMFINKPAEVITLPTGRQLSQDY
jgi:hypothetical protein